MSKPENRTNLALLAVLMVPAFRYWFLGRLGLPPNCEIYPPQTTSKQLRPDLVAVASGQVRAWIEIERGPENAAQMQAYHAAFPTHTVLCVVGRDDDVGPAGELSLEELARQLRSALGDHLDPQQSQSAQLFIGLVDEYVRGTSGSSATYVSPDSALQSNWFITKLKAVLGEALTFGVPPLRPGELQITTTSQKGWSLRHYCKGNSESSVALLWNTAAGQDVLRIPSFEKLDKFLGNRFAEDYRRFWIDGSRVDIATLSFGQSFGISQESLCIELEQFSRLILT